MIMIMILFATKTVTYMVDDITHAADKKQM